MYRIKEIQERLFALVGWEQSYNPAKAIETTLTASESGLYFQGAHPLLTLENIASIIPEDWDFQYPDWNLIRTYAIGEKVRFGGVVWIAKLANQNKEPHASDFNNDYTNDFSGIDTFWRPYNMLSDYLGKLTRDGIAKAIQTFIQRKVLKEETKNLLERTTFFDGAGRLSSTINNTGKLVGFEITNIKSLGVTSKIERIGLQMTGAVGRVRVYLYHSSQLLPVEIFDLNYTSTNGGFMWFDIKDGHLPNIGVKVPATTSRVDANGRWFLLYNQNDLPAGMQAVTTNKDWSVEPCGTCGVNNIHNWRNLMQYVEVSPFMTPAPTTFSQFPEFWNVEDVMYTSTQNYGLNVEMSVGCDLTDFIISQRALFQSVIQKQVAAIALRTMAMNPDVRINRNQSNASKMEILYELDGNTAGERPGGLGHDLKQSIDSLMLDTRNIDRVCLKCNSGGVKYRTI